MGDRAQVKVLMGNKDPKDPAVFLYTHWGGTGLLENVRNALAKRWRWGDPEYLARIIFDEMIPKSAHWTETGYGISTFEHGDNKHPLIVVDCDKQTVTQRGISVKFQAFTSV